MEPPPSHGDMTDLATADSDGADGDMRTIWGFRVQVDSAGRTHWPPALKAEAVRRAREGTRLSTIARDLGTHPTLIRKWTIKDRRKNGGWSETTVPFAELAVGDDDQGDDQGDDQRQDEPQRNIPATCRLELDGMSLEFPCGIRPEDLAGIVDVPRAGA